MNRQTLIGKQIDEYKLEALLGEGGMASVYRALDTRLNRYVAVKVILSSFQSDSEYVKRFEREAQAIAQLEHPGIITIYRFGEASGMLYMAMQYVDGADLAAVIESFHRDGSFIEFEEITRLAHEIGTALDYAHSKGVIHRDIKPHNILITQDGRAIVSDFGLALLTELGTRGEVFGSPHYIAPEQAISSAGAVPQSDLYALGIILYEMLTGHVPFDADEPLEVAMLHMSEAPPAPRSLRPELNPQVEAVLLKALAKQPEDRYPTGKALAVALEDALRSKPVQQAPSRHTIPQRVALELEANPLPPLPASITQQAHIPAAAATQLAPPQRPVPSAPLSEPTAVSPQSVQETFRTIPLTMIAVVAVMILAVIGLLIVSSLQSGNPAPSATPEQVAQVAASATEPLPTSTHTDTPIATATPEPVIVPATDAPPASQTWVLMIRWVREDSLFVQNISTIDFPLAGLELSGNGTLLGSEWGIAVLAPGQCVAVWKDRGNPQSANTSCELVGTYLTREGRDRFWKASFAVKFNDVRVDVCENSPCLVQISS